ncbi:MAG: hypothetical protein AAGB25_01695 [Pseudomonadota bacterium]
MNKLGILTTTVISAGVLGASALTLANGVLAPEKSEPKQVELDAPNTVPTAQVSIADTTSTEEDLLSEKTELAVVSGPSSNSSATPTSPSSAPASPQYASANGNDDGESTNLANALIAAYRDCDAQGKNMLLKKINAYQPDEAELRNALTAQQRAKYPCAELDQLVLAWLVDSDVVGDTPASASVSDMVAATPVSASLDDPQNTIETQTSANDGADNGASIQPQTRSPITPPPMSNNIRRGSTY